MGAKLRIVESYRFQSRLKMHRIGELSTKPCEGCHYNVSVNVHSTEERSRYFDAPLNADSLRCHWSLRYLLTNLCMRLSAFQILLFRMYSSKWYVSLANQTWLTMFTGHVSVMAQFGSRPSSSDY